MRPSWWPSRAEEIDRFLDDEVKQGRVETLCASPGGRRVKAVFYGQPEPELRGKANFNSALGARDPEAFYARGKRRRPVVFVLAGVHGQEVEGMVGALTLVKIMESGRDFEDGSGRLAHTT